MTKDEILTKLGTLRPALEAEGVQHLAVFGSRARGTNRIDSDLDMLIDVAPSTRFSILKLVGVEHIVQDATGLTANAFMRRSLRDTIRKEAENDAIEVF